MKRRDWAPLLELGDGKPRGPITGRKDHRLPDLETLLAIDRAAEAEARAQQAIPTPGVAAGERGVDGATSGTNGSVGTAGGEQGCPPVGPSGDLGLQSGTTTFPHFHTNGVKI